MLQKILAFLALIVFSQTHVVAETLRWEDYVGTWEMLHPTKQDNWVRYLVVDEEMFSFCPTKECEKPRSGTSVEVIGDLVLLSMYNGNDKTVAVVFGGFKGSVGASLMGTRYHYLDGSLISGLPMFYRKLQEGL